MAVDFNKMRVAISGGFGGIGQAICQGLLEGGVAHLAVLDLKEDQNALKLWKNAHPRQQIICRQVDVSKRQLLENVMKTLMDQMGGLDMFINCSGIVQDNDPNRTIQVNLMGTIYTTIAAVNLMGQHNGGNGGIVVNVASVLGLEPCYVFAVYSASKHGIVGFTRSLSHEFHYNKTGIRFITICPGPTVTKLTTDDTSQATTFEYAAAEGPLLQTFKMQTPDICAKNILKAIQTGKNGSVWICDLDTLKEATFKEYWKPTF